MKSGLWGIACSLLFGAAAFAEASPGNAPHDGAAEQTSLSQEHYRVLPLAGGRNFRDLGGYRTADGRTVQWGKIFRAGSMTDLTPSDMRHLDALGIKSVFDLRSSDERTAGPNHWVVGRSIHYWTYDYPVSRGDLSQVFDGQMTPARATATMREIYRTLAYEQAPAFKALFQQLASESTPTAFNCTAGKDRTGIAAALILSALGVPREAIMQDYLLTNTVRVASPRLSSQQAEGLSRANPDVLRAFGTADPSYLEAAFDEMSRRDGSISGYIHNTLGIGPDQISRMKAHFLK